MLERLSFTLGNPLPVILQTEVAECGLACLAMVCGYHGNRTDIGILRRRYSASIKGMSLKSLMQTATKLGFANRAIRLDVVDFANLRMPCVLHWDFSHFVVLAKVTAKGIVVHDPALGRRYLTIDEASTHFTGVALELWPTGGFEKKVEKERIRLSELFRNVSGLKCTLSQLFLLSLCLEVFALVSPIGSQIIIDQVVVSADRSLLTTVAIALCLFLLLQTMIGIARGWAGLVMGTSLNLQWTTGLFDHLLRLPLSYFEKRHIGDVVSRFSSLAPIQTALTTDIIEAILDVLVVVGSLCLMLLYGGWLTWIAVATLALQTLIRVVSYPAYRSANEAAIVQHAREESHFLESIRGIASLKALDLYEPRRATWLNLMIESLNAGLRVQKLDLVFGTTNGLLGGCDRIIMLWLGASAVIDGTMTIGMLIAFLAYKDQFTGRVSALTGLAVRLKMLGMHGERIADIALSQPEDETGGDRGDQDMSRFKGSLELKNLNFQYSDSDPQVLSDINLAIHPGEIIALTGPSGSGKTTLMKLMAGLLAIQDGGLRIDGQEINRLGLANYRKVVACVLQDDRLFAGTIAENISGFDPEHDHERVRECARLASIAEEINAMPMVYETLVGDMGSALSGGQRQRLFLARALYRQPKILFLDEATSHLDEDNERTINDALTKLSITRIIMAHRQTSINLAHRIFRIESGKIEEITN